MQPCFAHSDEQLTDLPGDKLYTQVHEYMLAEAIAEARVSLTKEGRHKAVSAAWLCAAH